MTYCGHVENGMIVLNDNVRLPDGMEVKVEPVEAESPVSEDARPTLYDRFKDVIGRATGLPEDMAAQHDHYIHGAPKK